MKEKIEVARIELTEQPTQRRVDASITHREDAPSKMADEEKMVSMINHCRLSHFQSHSHYIAFIQPKTLTLNFLLKLLIFSGV
jgi:hypothetical protein